MVRARARARAQWELLAHRLHLLKYSYLSKMKVIWRPSLDLAETEKESTHRRHGGRVFFLAKAASITTSSSPAISTMSSSVMSLTTPGFGECPVSSRWARAG